jgi:hypothetical protein
MPIDDPGWGSPTPPPQQPAPPSQDPSKKTWSDVKLGEYKEKLSGLKAGDYKEKLSGLKAGDYKEKLSGLARYRGKLGKLNEKQMIAVGIAVVVLIAAAGLLRSKDSDEKPAGARGAAGGAAAAPSGASGSQASGSQEDFVAKVEQICVSYREQVMAAAQSADPTILGGVQGRKVAEMKALGTPPEDAEVFQRLISGYESYVQAQNQGSASASQFIQSAGQAAHEFGAPSCA